MLQIFNYSMNFRVAPQATANRTVVTQSTIKAPVKTTNAGSTVVSKITKTTSGQSGLSVNVQPNLKSVGTVKTSADATKR